MSKKRSTVLYGCVLAMVVSTVAARAQNPMGTAFTYQGLLQKDGSNVGSPTPVACDFDFGLWDDPASGDPGNVIGSVGIGGVDVAAGLFTAKVDFGPGAFNGDARWLEVYVCCPAGTCASDEDWTRLDPRQELTPGPYALYAANGGGGGGGYWSANVDHIYNDNSGNVGIGTATPQASLDIALIEAGGGPSLMVAGASQFNDNIHGGPNNFLSLISTLPGEINESHIAFTTSDGSGQVERVRIAPDGNVGIGVTNPNLGKLHVEGSGTFTVYAKNEATSGSAEGGRFETDSTEGIGVYGMATALSGVAKGVMGQSKSSTAGAAGVLGMASAATGKTYGVYGETKSSTDDASGVFGIAGEPTGVTYGVFGRTQSGTLHAAGVYGEHFTSAGEGYGVYGRSFSDSAGATGVHGWATSSTSNVTYGGRFQSDSSTGQGVRGQGHTGGAFFSSDETGRGVFARASHSTGVNYGLYAQTSSSNGYAGYFWGDVWVQNGDVCVEGDINYSGSLGTCSDARFKKNIDRIASPLEKIGRLRGVHFDWKRTEFPDRRFKEGRQVGFIAQEIEGVLPEVVSKGRDGFSYVDYGRVVPTLLEAVNELHGIVQEKDACIAELEVDNDAQHDRIASLEARLAALEMLMKRADAGERGGAR